MTLRTYWIDDRVLVIEPGGELTSDTAETFFHLAQSLIEHAGPRIVIDCGQLTMISSMGLAALIRFHARMRRHVQETQGPDAQVNIRLAALSGPVAQVIHLMKLDRVFAIYPDTRAAMVGL